jgi:hypothetical protein
MLGAIVELLSCWASAFYHCPRLGSLFFRSQLCHAKDSDLRVEREPALASISVSEDPVSVGE